MKEICFALLALVVTASCTRTETITVRGTVSDPKLNNSKVYFVALDGPISKDVDSTIIVDGKFSFEKEG